MIYLDSAATSFIKPKSVAFAMQNALKSMSSPGRGSYRQAMKAADMVYECRELASKLFNFDTPERVVFTQNATHALNIAIHSLVKPGDRVLTSGYEHNSVTRALKGVGAEIVAAKSELFAPELAFEAFREHINSCDVVICNHISNVFGYILPVYEIAELCRIYGKPFILDASQSAGVCDIDAKRLCASFIAMPGHKGLLGPQGTGILLCNADVKPITFGGTGSDSILQDMPEFLPDRAEAGTLNVVGIAGLRAGIEYVLNRTPQKLGNFESSLCARMADNLSTLPNVEVFRADNSSQAGVISIRHSTIDCETLCERLGKAGIAARCGLHCSPLAHTTAGTIETGTLRFSFCPFTKYVQVDEASRALARIIVQ